MDPNNFLDQLEAILSVESPITDIEEGLKSRVWSQKLSLGFIGDSASICANLRGDPLIMNSNSIGKESLQRQNVESSLPSSSEGVQIDETKFANKYGADFLSAIKDTAQKLNIDPTHLIVCMAFESNLNPQAQNINKNGQRGAVGLIQFTGGTAASLGKTKDEIVRMSAAQQMSLVERYLRSRGKLRYGYFEDIYIAIFGGKVGGDPSTPIYKRGTQDYINNSGMDLDKDGVITIGEAAKKAWNRGIQNLKAAGVIGNSIPLSSKDILNMRS